MKGQQRQQVERLRHMAMRRGVAVRLSGLSDNELAAKLRTGRDAFLASPEWKTLSAKVLLRYGWKCMCCGRVPAKRSSVNVDHIKPRKFYPELALDEDNLQVLCGRCNKRKGNDHMTDYRQSPCRSFGSRA
jgi:5-methylcytosine-specific restriction protein A